MEISSPGEVVKIVDQFLMLVYESAEYHSLGEVRSVLQEASRILIAARRRLKIVADRYVVGVVGLTNVGKSTLLNALMGAELAPRRNGPCTAAPIELVYGEKLRVTVYYRNSLTRPSWSCENIEAVHQRLALMSDEEGEVAGREVRKVSVEASLPLLGNGLVIADTPGFGAAQAGEADGAHEAALKGYLKDEVSQVFWVVLADQGIGKREKSFCDTFFAEICDDVVVTGSEDWESRDRERFRRRYADVFSGRRPQFHFVSGLKGAEARRAQDAESLEKAGIPMLEARIRELVNPAGRLAAVKEGIIRLAEDLHYWLKQFRDNQQRPLSTWWRPDSWSRWRACQPKNPLKQQLMAHLGTFQ
ncbi:MAG: dynamin family protein [Pirellulales bacterium]|nr:dynamin family protein [Pirellulales bacterium]